MILLANSGRVWTEVMTVSNNSLVINFNIHVRFNRETRNKDCEFFLAPPSRTTRLRFFRPSTDPVLVKAVTARS